MSFISEIAAIFGNDDLTNSYRVTLFGESAAYIEGVKYIKSYSQDKIELFVLKGELKITGEKLFVKKYCLGDMAICGIIKTVEKN